MTLKNRQSFTEFQQDHRRKSTAWLTSIPEFDEVVAAWHAGAGVSQLVAWLRSCGHADVTPAKVGDWLRANEPR